LVGSLRHWHVPCELTRLDYGDAAFCGNGPRGPVAVGFEIKRVHDALQCMQDGRFAGRQLPGLVNTYDYTWLVLEGRFKPDFVSGLLLVDGVRRRELALGSRRFMYRDLDNWVTTMEICAGIKCRRTADRQETARFLADCYGWWTKDFHDHHAHLALHQDQGRPDAALFARPSVARMVAAQLPGIGYKKSAAVVKKFETVLEMVNANENTWAEIDGIGATMAERIVRALRTR
jgi:ERCC4-type nuclease